MCFDAHVPVRVSLACDIRLSLACDIERNELALRIWTIVSVRAARACDTVEAWACIDVYVLVLPVFVAV